MIEQEILRHGYVFIFAGSILEADTTLLTSAYLAHAGYLSMPVVYPVAVSAAFFINEFYFFTARWKGTDWVDAHIRQDGKVAKVRQAVSRNAASVFLVSRFTPGFRTIVPVLCGASGVDPVRFAAFNLASTLLWAAAVSAAGFFGRQLLTVLAGDISRHEGLIGTALAVCALIAWLVMTKGRDWRDAAAILWRRHRSKAG